jgi:uncharacterized protein (TIGR02246 family)
LSALALLEDPRRPALCFADAINRRDSEAAGALFAPDGVWSLPGLPDAVGPAAIAERVRALLAEYSAVIQIVNEGWMQMDGDIAVVRWYVSEVIGDETSASTSIGVYHDLVRREADGWRFSRRRYQAMYVRAADGTAKVRAFPSSTVEEFTVDAVKAGK